MKGIRVICIVLSLLMLLPVLGGCTSGKVSATVSLKFVIPAEDEEAEDAVKLNLPALKVEGTKDNPPTVLQAVQEAFQEYEIPYELTADGTSIAGVYGLTGEQWYDDEKGYYTLWECSINGTASAEGRQSVTKIYEGDAIVFTWKSGERPLENTGVVETTDPDADTTGNIPSNTTAEITDD